MLSNLALDIFIGLVFVYLLYSLLATIIQEIIASFLNLRAVVLVKAIRIMLTDRPPVSLKSKSVIGKAWEKLMISLTNQWHYLACLLPDHTLAKAFYKHPSIKYLSPSISRSKPSYIEPSNFSTTLIQILRGKDYDGSRPVMYCVYNTLFPMITAAQPAANTTFVQVGETNPVTAEIQPETLDHLRQLYIDSKHDLNAFVFSLENWYNQTMDRASGWYKRQTRRILFFIGLTVAIWGNVDTIKIYHVLSKDKNAREQLVQLAVESQKKYEGITEQTRKEKPALQDSNGAAQAAEFLAADSLLFRTYDEVKQDADQSSNVLAMGWHSSQSYHKLDSLQKLQNVTKDSLQKVPRDSALQKRADILSNQIKTIKPLALDKFDGMSSCLGWLITALALTLGAPFWFDLLSKFISLRATGKKPEIDREISKIEKHPLLAAAAVAPMVTASETIVLGSEQPEFVPDESNETNTPIG